MLILFLLFAGFCNVYSLRSCFSVAIVHMVKNTTYTDLNGTIWSKQEFDWNTREQGILLSAFFWGYVPSQLLGALLTLKYGGKMIIGMSILIPSFLSFVMPMCIDFGGFYLVIIIRILQGVFEGGVYTGTLPLISKWVPEQDRSKSYTIVVAGTFIGTSGGMAMSGIICYYFGWRRVLQSAGVFGIIWWVIWQQIVTDIPEKSKLISSPELAQIQATRGSSAHILVNLKEVPYRKIITSLPVLALSILAFTEFCGVYTMLTELPTYFSDVYKIDIIRIGVYSGLPYVCMAIFAIINGCIVDSLGNILRVNTLRKVCVSFGFCSQILFLTLLIHSYSFSNSMACLVCSLCFGSINQACYGPNCIELNPKYSSVIMGITSSICNISGIVAPLVCGLVVKTGTREEWNNIFMIIICVYVFGLFSFWILGSSNYQNWDDEPEYNDLNASALACLQCCKQQFQSRPSPCFRMSIPILQTIHGQELGNDSV
ncbi:Vesicular glutamate transporter 2.1 [Nymphon striatum]|nr:Vesicular glutamate transporter 2.1 [Nymphon striatum]